MAEGEHVVGPGDTAVALGSGEVPVLGTPRLLAWLEAATVRALAGELGDAETSVGTRVELRHRRPSPVGSRVLTRAELVARDGRRLELRATAHSADGELLGEATIHRAVVARADLDPA